MKRRSHDPGNRYPSFSGYEYGFVDRHEIMREARRMQAEAMAQMFGAPWRGLGRLFRILFAPATTERDPGQLAGRAEG